MFEEYVIVKIVFQTVINPEQNTSNMQKYVLRLSVIQSERALKFIMRDPKKT